MGGECWEWEAALLTTVDKANNPDRVDPVLVWRDALYAAYRRSYLSYRQACRALASYNRQLGPATPYVEAA
ncbi:hypothetical protein [Actinobaculum sp. 352]|uniref:hypothetical protein n=1 Tax=Actinobaculum sp. 352 TaxID=2490946 RepID=UPI000F7F1945|nr:hypothetical protein [Actinobaculum sp. 352]RTE48799.1 hypothetical protein EKN07_08825 [Actinobaculum sp. 352]